MKRFPHPLALLAGCIALSAILSYLVPAGRYERRDDPATGRAVVVPGTYHHVDPRPVGPFDALVAIPKGMADAGTVIFAVLLMGGAFVVVEKTGALRRSTEALARRLASREILVIPIVSLCFATGGALNNMSEEIIPLIPVVVLLMGGLGYSPLVACAASIGAAAVGASFSPVNPYQVIIAQKLAQLAPLSGGLLRIVFLTLALAVWIGTTMRHAAASRQPAAGSQAVAATNPVAGARLPAADVVILLLVVASFALLVTGLLVWHWDLDQMAALFFLMGVLVGLVGRLGINGTAAAFAEGFGTMAYAAALIGFARAIYIVLDQGAIVDTLVYGLFTPIAGLPAYLASLAMMVAQFGVHVPVPSVSGQAVLTMPVLVPLSDLIGMHRQATVLAFQYGAGLADLLTPTNASLMAVIGAAGVGYGDWLRFALPRVGLLLLLAAVALAVAFL